MTLTCLYYQRSDYTFCTPIFSIKNCYLAQNIVTFPWRFLNLKREFHLHTLLYVTRNNLAPLCFISTAHMHKLRVWTSILLSERIDFWLHFHERWSVVLDTPQTSYLFTLFNEHRYFLIQQEKISLLRPKSVFLNPIFTFNERSLKWHQILLIKTSIFLSILTICKNCTGGNILLLKLL